MPNAQRPIPILMYHKVGASVDSKAGTFLNVSARSLERQMRLLAHLGYRGITFREAAAALFEGASLPRKPVCVTFDDGYECVADSALPVLKRFRWPATVFVPTAYVGQSNTWDEAFGNPILPIMHWAGLRSLADEGWEISGHTRTHPKLAELLDSEAEREMADGKRDLEERLGSTVSTFCYPFGSVGATTPALCRKVGFRAACTTRSGLASAESDPLLLPRVKIAYRDDVWGLLYRLLIRPRLP